MISSVQISPFNIEDDSFNFGQYLGDDDQYFDSGFSSNAFSSTAVNKSLQKVNISEDVIDFLSQTNSKPIGSLFEQSPAVFDDPLIMDSSSPADIAASLYTSDHSHSSSPTFSDASSETNHSLYSHHINNQSSFSPNDFQSPSSSSSFSHPRPVEKKNSLNAPSFHELALIKSHLSPELIIYLFDSAELKELQEKLIPYTKNTDLHSKFRVQIDRFFQLINRQHSHESSQHHTKPVPTSQTPHNSAPKPIDDSLFNFDMDTLSTNQKKPVAATPSSRASGCIPIAPSPQLPHNMSKVQPSTSYVNDRIGMDGRKRSSVHQFPPSSSSSSSLDSSSASSGSKPIRKQSESRISLPELYQRMGLGHDHNTARSREQRILTILKKEGFRLGERTWIRDTSEKERRRMIDEIYRQTYPDYHYSKELIEVIVRRGSYYLMQGRLRRIRRGKKVETGQSHDPTDSLSSLQMGTCEQRSLPRV